MCWLQEPRTNGRPVATLELDSKVGEGGIVAGTVTIGGKQERVSLRLGEPPAPPPPCAAGSQRVCGECMLLPAGLTCPKGQKVDVLLASGDDGSCSCDEYCATNWGGHVKSAKPGWTGATSVFGKNSSVFGCGSVPGAPKMCACVQATHFCPAIVHLCKSGCDKVGSPVPLNYCVPA
jgi:hypothetical protein